MRGNSCIKRIDPLQTGLFTQNPIGLLALGLGTFKMNAGEVREITKAALASGYRHIDTAQATKNEAEVGEGLRAAVTPHDHVVFSSYYAKKIHVLILAKVRF